MLKHGTGHWTAQNADGMLFFAQRLSELLFDYTLDTHKPSALNATALCDEARQVIRDVSDGLIDAANIDHVLDELTWSIKNDPVTKKLLDSDPSFYILRGENISRDDQLLRLEVLGKTINAERYYIACVEKLEDSISNNAKKDIEIITRNLITSMINTGISKEFLFQTTKQQFFDSTNPVTDLGRVTDFFDAISPKVHRFEVYFKLNAAAKEVKDSNEAFAIKIISQLPAELSGVIKSESLVCEEGDCYVQLDVPAPDRVTAFSLAEQRLDTLSDLIVFYTHKKTLNWSSSAIVRQQCCSTATCEVSHPLNAMAKGRNFRSDFAAARLNALITNIQLRGGSFSKFNQVVDLHGMALASDVPSNQLLNLWIALETIVPSSRGGKTTVQRITAAIMPFLLEGYVRRLVVTLTKDMYRWDRRKAGKLLSDVPGGGKAVAKVLRLLILNECAPLRDTFLAALTDFPLLRFRIRTMTERLSSPKSVLTLLDQHRQKVEWQIRRIYRTRNSMVHAGTEPKYTAVLIENCHDYLDIVLNSVIRMSCNEYAISTLDQAFELAEVQYQKFCRKLKQYDAFSTTHGDFMVGAD